MASGQPNRSSSTSSSSSTAAAAPAPAPQPPRGRRSSVTELLSRPPNVAPRLNTAQSTGAGAMAAITGTAAAAGGGGAGGAPLFSTAATGGPHAPHRRRTSITTLGLSGSSPTQVNAFNPGSLPTMRRASTSSSQTSTSPNTEHAVLEENEQEESPGSSSPVTPFARRVSFGTQAMRDRVGNRSGSEGFNWPEALRTRAERAPSLSAYSPTSPQAQFSLPVKTPGHHRAASVATMEISPQRDLVAEAQSRPPPPRQPPPKPDYFQEKILRADFMD